MSVERPATIGTTAMYTTAIPTTTMHTTTAQRWLMAAVRWYQRLVEGRPSPCRFSPSCSSYAHEALHVHGTMRGVVLTLRRLSRCRPLGPSGWDPVPEPRHAQLTCQEGS